MDIGTNAFTTYASADTGGLAIDPQGFGDLKGLARKGDDKALLKVAQEFEAIMTRQLLKSMREASPGDGLGDSEATKSFTSMLDDQYAQTLTHGRGLGLADMIVRQVREAEGRGVKPATVAAVND